MDKKTLGRMCQEWAQLTNRINRLLLALNCIKDKTLVVSRREELLMKQQLHAMLKYRFILATRIGEAQKKRSGDDDAGNR